MKKCYSKKLTGWSAGRIVADRTIDNRKDMQLISPNGPITQVAKDVELQNQVEFFRLSRHVDSRFRP